MQDCLAWAYEYIHPCQHTKKENIILKQDFEQTFDMVEHDITIKILEKKVLNGRWLNWIKNILCSGTSSILLNGVPGKSFTCKRGAADLL